MGELELPRTLAGRFRLESVLGQGGMGTVYRAVDTTMQRPVAIKLIEPDPNAEDDAVLRFLREARNTARITHPHIVHLYDLGRGDRGELFFVMELLAGESLSDRIRRFTRLPVDEAVHIAKQMCGALGYAHKKGLVHRDLKPANVMILERGGDPLFVKVLDFGVAKAQDQGTQITKTGALVGTVDYMAPEQILSKKIDARTDVYSLGVILYRMLTGTPLFPEGAMPLVIKNHISSQPEPMSSRAPDVELSPGLERVVMQCLAKKPEERYATMEELEHALMRAAREPRQRSMAPREFDDLSDMKTVRRDSMADAAEGRASARPERVAPPHATDSDTKLAIPRRESNPSHPGISPSRPHAAVSPQRQRSVDSTPMQASGRSETPPGGVVARRESLHGTGSSPAVSTVPQSQPQPPSHASGANASRWIGFLAPLPAAVYVAYQAFTGIGPTPPALALLGGGLVVGGVLFIVGIGRSRS